MEIKLARERERGDHTGGRQRGATFAEESANAMGAGRGPGLTTPVYTAEPGKVE